IKPLYSFRDRNRLIYASEIKAFFADESISAQVNQTALQDYLTLQYTLGDSTLFEGVRKLPPSHYEITDVGSGETRRSAYWELAFDTDRECSEGEYLDELQWLLRDA